jgi:hypothetical protein
MKDLREEIVKVAFSIAAISTLRGKCTLRRDEKGYQKYNHAIDEKIRELVCLFRDFKNGQGNHKEVQ